MMRKRFLIAGALTALWLAASAVPALAITVGQTSATTATCAANLDVTSQSVTSGNSYVVPSTGGIANWTMTSWSTIANGTANQALSMKIWRNVGGLNYQAISHDGPRTLTPNSLNTFQTNLAVRAGDILGLHTVPANVGCVFNTGDPGDVPPFRGNSDLQDGQSGTFTVVGAAGFRENISAQLVPTNAFTIASIARNKKKGKANATLTVPNPGTLVESGKGVKAASSSSARSAATVGAAGNLTLAVRPKGKKKKKLRSKGKVKLNVTFTYTPTGGTASALSAKVVLKKKR